MIKTYCDGCNRELTSSNDLKGGFNLIGRLGIELCKNGKTLKVEMITSKDNVANQGDWCRYCVIDAINKLDDRPQVIPEYAPHDR